MTALLSIGAWFLKNPVWLLVAGLLVALAGVGIDDGVHRLELSSCREARATEKADAEKAKSDALAKAQALSDELVIAQAQAMAQTEKTVTVYRDRIIHAAVTNSCGPSVRDAARGVLDTLHAGGGPAGPVSRSP